MKSFRSISRGGLIIIALLFVTALMAIATISPFGATIGSFGLIPIAFGAVSTEANYFSDVILKDEEVSRDKVTVLSGQNLSIGTVLGKITKSCPTAGTADAGNTATTGTCTEVTAGALAKLGTYTLTCIAKVADAGTFQVKAPDGSVLPPATGDVAYTSPQINFLINVTATDYEVGDEFTITVAKGSGSVKILDTEAVDGTQDAYGILGAAVDASAGARSGFAVARDAVAKLSGLVWPEGISEGEKTAALEQLEAKFIVTRKGA